jgi:hypothetical protein
MITRLDHIQLAMPRGEEARARAYYAGVLGLEEEAKPEPLVSRGGCWFRLGSVLVHLGVEEPFRPQKKAHPAFCVDKLEEAASALVRAGSPVTWDTTLPSRRRFHSEDPFGNRIEFLGAGDGFSER